MTRLRDLGITIGEYAPGAHNAITDVAGVRVGFTTLIEGAGERAVRTGVTAVLPHTNILREFLFAGSHVLNGCGEMTGLAWIAEAGQLTSPVVITNTHAIGAAHEGIVRYGIKHGSDEDFMLPVAAETYDGYLSDINGLHVRPEHVVAALEAASDGPPAEGNVGGGTGMICHGFKGGTGTASRRFETAGGEWTVGALVQANYGARRHLRVNGVPVGSRVQMERIPGYRPPPQSAGSIIILLASDAPLLPDQCRRLAQRATIGLARVGGTGYNGSGDIFLAWSTANKLPAGVREQRSVRMIDQAAINPLFDAAAEAVEEAILNALVAAETLEGLHGRVVYALPHDQLLEIIV
jgi:D-aminopeptidase